MGIFKKRAKDGAATGDQPDEVIEVPPEGSEQTEVDVAGDDSPEEVEETVAVVDRSAGPFDVTEVDDDLERVDFGSLRFAVSPELQLQVDADETTQQYTGVTAIVDGSACQIQAFAAPKSRGVWREIRGEIADNLIAGGGSTDIVDGPFGPELHAKLPSQGPDGRTVLAPARFVGVDGPRWFLRIVLSGNAAVDDAAAEPLLAFARSVVVVRGSEPRAPRELLELTLPEALTQAPEEAAAAATALNPFERGPEITEVR
ncbi:uncharacterized protein DUF3710 [Branchiibius hedensis]|uniref:DUF3710 domain-containing protein n=1 Tax=Branchiibius hedensis TaxID=672460 RepID=A0A2Y8ZP60_9MICO|nr:DUF3710 domain-containing protein [Branchiibius hedensis]PWJ24899.1 uncharacterized protein DUF3710 [Branchiibius hedensis]SSA33715.1 Protein of unknown function [Branchiibius hedensis]